jgi:hypothetical protein
MREAKADRRFVGGPHVPVHRVDEEGRAVHRPQRRGDRRVLGGAPHQNFPREGHTVAHTPLGILARPERERPQQHGRNGNRVHVVEHPTTFYGRRDGVPAAIDGRRRPPVESPSPWTACQASPHAVATWLPFRWATRGHSGGFRGFRRGPETPGEPRNFVEEKWSGKRDLNPRPQPWQGCALPLSYSRDARILAGHSQRVNARASVRPAAEPSRPGAETAPHPRAASD